MGIFQKLFGVPGEATATAAHVINPTTLLPMVDDYVDVAGNVFGMEPYDALHVDNGWSEVGMSGDFGDVSVGIDL